MKQVKALNIYAAVDPGSTNGGVGWQIDNRSPNAAPLPALTAPLREWVEEISDLAENKILFIESQSMWGGDIKGGPMTKKQKSAQIGRAMRMQKLIKNYTETRLVFEMCGWTIVDVQSNKWQTDLNLKVKGESRAKRKKRYVKFASKHYPKIFAKLNIGQSERIGDAMCILLWGRNFGM